MDFNVEEKIKGKWDQRGVERNTVYPNWCRKEDARAAAPLVTMCEPSTCCTSRELNPGSMMATTTMLNAVAIPITMTVAVSVVMEFSTAIVMALPKTVKVNIAMEVSMAVATSISTAVAKAVAKSLATVLVTSISIAVETTVTMAEVSRFSSVHGSVSSVVGGGLRSRQNTRDTRG